MFIPLMPPPELVVVVLIPLMLLPWLSMCQLVSPNSVFETHCVCIWTLMMPPCRCVAMHHASDAASNVRCWNFHGPDTTSKDRCCVVHAPDATSRAVWGIVYVADITSRAKCFIICAPDGTFRNGCCTFLPLSPLLGLIVIEFVFMWPGPSGCRHYVVSDACGISNHIMSVFVFLIVAAGWTCDHCETH